MVQPARKAAPYGENSAEVDDADTKKFSRCKSSRRGEGPGKIAPYVDNRISGESNVAAKKKSANKDDKI